jgi:hypothetical protein
MGKNEKSTPVEPKGNNKRRPHKHLSPFGLQLIDALQPIKHMNIIYDHFKLV